MIYMIFFIASSGRSPVCSPHHPGSQVMARGQARLKAKGRLDVMDELNQGDAVGVFADIFETLPGRLLLNSFLIKGQKKAEKKR